VIKIFFIRCRDSLVPEKVRSEPNQISPKVSALGIASRNYADLRDQTKNFHIAGKFGKIPQSAAYSLFTSAPPTALSRSSQAGFDASTTFSFIVFSFFQFLLKQPPSHDGPEDRWHCHCQSYTRKDQCLDTPKATVKSSLQAVVGYYSRYLHFDAEFWISLTLHSGRPT
jgi:hypothetical protein